MPCRDWEDIPRVYGHGQATANSEIGQYKTDIAKLKNQNHRLARLLCSACKLIVEAGVRDKMPKDLSEWWWAHDKADRKNQK